MSLDLSDPKITQAINDVKAQGSTNWLLLGYVPKSDTKATLVDTGSGGLKELSDQLNDGKIFYGLISYDINNTKKFVYLAWCGEGVTGMKKGLFNNHANDVSRLFKGFHVQINARNEDDLNEANILAKLKKATGASYDSGARIQGTQSSSSPDVPKQHASAALNKNDYNKKEESEKFWKQQREEEERAKVSAASQPQRGPVSTGSVKGRFENSVAKNETAPARPAPAPVKSFTPAPAPVPAKPAPVPARQAPVPPKEEYIPAPQHEAPPVPEPEPEPQYEEQQQWEEPQQQYEEQQQYQEEPQQQYDQYAEQQQWEEPQQQYEEQQQYQEEPQQQQYDEYAEQQQQDYGQEQQYDQGAYQGQAKALYDFDGENPDDLSFREGEIINVLEKNPDGWWRGDIDGRVGYFPSNFVEETA